MPATAPEREDDIDAGILSIEIRKPRKHRMTKQEGYEKLRDLILVSCADPTTESCYGDGDQGVTDDEVVTSRLEKYVQTYGGGFLQSVFDRPPKGESFLLNLLNERRGRFLDSIGYATAMIGVNSNPGAGKVRHPRSHALAFSA